MTEERRGAKRYILWIPVQVASGSDVQMLAVSRNISWSGALVIAGASLEIGRKVELTLQIPGTGAEQKLAAEIVRVETNEEDPEGLWRYRLAVKFDKPMPELEEAFDELQSMSG